MNFAVSDERSVRVFGINDEELAGHQVDVGTGRLGVEGTVGIGIVGLSDVADILDGFPSDTLLAFQQNVYVYIGTMGFQRLLFGGYSFGVHMVDEQVVSANFDTAWFGMEQVVRLHIVKQCLEQGMKGFKIRSLCFKSDAIMI